MSVKHQVKPSKRTRQENLQRNSKIIKIVAVVAAVAIVAGLGIFVGPKVADRLVNGKAQSEPKKTQEVMRVMLAESAGYEGAWYVQPDGKFQIYLPCTVKKEDPGVQSLALYTTENSLMACGVATGDGNFSSLDGDITSDMQSVATSVISKITSDAKLCFYGANFSGSYEFTTKTLTSGEKVMWLKGELLTNLVTETEDGQRNTDELKFPLYAMGILVDDVPYVIWGSCDPDAAAEASELEGKMEACLTTLWRTSTMPGNDNDSELSDPYIPSTAGSTDFTSDNSDSSSSSSSSSGDTSTGTAMEHFGIDPNKPTDQTPVGSTIIKPNS